jgi:NADPH-dependent 2,4-dienoyl-CoA reductase/sulfur reductase-like enzyme/nitrite reductase/ring-hydroxylating ferredoxin subunit
MGESAPLTGPDLAQGIAFEDVPEGGSLLGHHHGEAVLLVRPTGGEDVFAVGATCSHYGGPLAEGCVVAHEVRCPWHHARFDIRTGDAVAAPALSSLPCWRVERRDDRLVLADKLVRAPRIAAEAPSSVIIVGAGAAGHAAAEMLRTEGYAGTITMIGADAAPPVDRPNLSKDYLAGTAPEEWVTLRDEAFFAQHHIELVLGTRVTRLDPSARKVELSDGTSRSYEALLLATGAEPVKLPLTGDHVCYVRTLADSRAIIARASQVKRVVVVGASFIGLEVAASLRARDLEVHVVAPDARPLERVLGPEIGDFVRALHEEHGVRFHLGRTVASLGDDAVVLDDGTRIPAELVVVGVGVRPVVALAEQAGLAIDRGVVVNERLETSAAGVWAAGDIARWPDARSGTSIRVEHWVVAQRQGQTAARNILGKAERFGAVPFFWSQHYDVTISYVGHAESWDRIEVIGSIADRSCVVVYRAGSRVAAIATMGRDKVSLEAESLMERGDERGLEALLARPAGP